MNAVDTNVLVYFLDKDEPIKRATAIALLDRIVKADEETILPWQVAAELLSCLRRWENEGRISRTETLGNLRHMGTLFRCVLPTPFVLEKSLELSSRYSLSHWDSMLLAACVEAGVTTLFSEDLASGAVYESLTIVNPFRA